MTLPEATGLITKPEALLATTLSECYYFQRWQGNSWSASQALEHIYHEGLGSYDDNLGSGWDISSLKTLRPFAFIWTDEEGGFRLDADSATSFQPGGNLIIRFEQAVPAEVANNQAHADRLFKLDIEKIIKGGNDLTPGLVELNRQAGYRDFYRLEFAGPFRTAREDRTALGDAQACYIGLEWGVTR